MNGSVVRTTSRARLAIFGAALIGFIPSHTVNATPQYSVTDLGTFGGEASAARGINERGQVVGYAQSADQIKHAFRSAPRGKKPALTYFGNSTESFSEGYAINSAGQIAVTRDLSLQVIEKLRKQWEQKTGKAIALVSGSTLGLRSTPDGTPPKLSAIPPRIFRTQPPAAHSYTLDVSTIVLGVNNSGQLVGLTDATPTINGHAFRTTGNSGKPELIDLGTLGGLTSVANGINNKGQAVGTSEIAQIDSDAKVIRHAFRSTGNGKKFRLTDLGTLGGPDSNGQAINDKGQVTGSAQLGDLSYHAYRSSGNGEDASLIDLGTLGGNVSQGLAINRKGYVVGASKVPVGDEFHGFLWDGELHDLNDLIPDNSGWTVTIATGINNRNEISANGVNADGRRHALLLAPTTH